MLNAKVNRNDVMFNDLELVIAMWISNEQYKEQFDKNLNKDIYKSI